MTAQCWVIWETTYTATFSGLHRCELDEGHQGSHRCEGMFWMRDRIMAFHGSVSPAAVALPHRSCLTEEDL